MAGAPYAAGGIRVTTEATRAACDRRARAARRAPAATRRARAGITHLEIKSGYGLDVETERRCCEVAAALHRRRHLPRRPRRARRVRRPRRRLRRARRAATMLDACAPLRPLDRRLLRGRARSTPTSRARCSRPAAPPGLGLRVHANQLGPGPGRAARGRARRRLGRPLHLPRPTPTSTRSPASDTVATFLPGHRLLDPPALPRRPPRDRRRRRRSRIATNCNPGSSYTTSMAFCIALAVRDMRMTDRGGAARPPPSAAPARCAAPTSAASPPARAPTLVDPRRALLHPPRLPPRRAARRRDVWWAASGST